MIFKDFENMDQKLSKKFNSFKKGYSQKDAEKVLSKQSKILGIMKNPTLQKYFDDVSLYFQMLKEFFSGKYKSIPIGSIAAIIGTLLYILSPIDIIPDLIPGGFVDDLGILITCLNFTKVDVEEYKKSKCEIQQNQLINQMGEHNGKEKYLPKKETKKTFFAKIKKILPLIVMAKYPKLAIANQVVENSINSLYKWLRDNKICPLIKANLDTFYKRTVINSLITLALNVIGMIFVIFDPFGEKTSYIVATLFFVVAFSFTLCRFIVFMMNKQYREITFQLIQKIWKTKSVSKGVQEVVLNSIPKLAILYKGIDVMSNILPALETIPDIQEIIKYIISIFWKRVSLFLGLIVFYLIMFYGVLKPLVLFYFN